jgi:hypothetical protein
MVFPLPSSMHPVVNFSYLTTGEYGKNYIFPQSYSYRFLMRFLPNHRRYSHTERMAGFGRHQ